MGRTHTESRGKACDKTDATWQGCVLRNLDQVHHDNFNEKKHGAKDPAGDPHAKTSGWYCIVEETRGDVGDASILKHVAFILGKKKSRPSGERGGALEFCKLALPCASESSYSIAHAELSVNVCEKLGETEPTRAPRAATG